jgi:hypothetical protein
MINVLILYAHIFNRQTYLLVTFWQMMILPILLDIHGLVQIRVTVFASILVSIEKSAGIESSELVRDTC